MTQWDLSLNSTSVNNSTVELQEKQAILDE